MIVLNCENICFSVGVKEILNEVSFYIEEGDKVGIIGVNGAGKTTLFRIITGELASDRGNVSIMKNAAVGVLRQDPALNETETVYNSVMSVFNHLKNLEIRISSIEKQLSDYDYNAENNENNTVELDYLQKLLDSHSKLITEYTDKGGYEYEGKTKSVLESLGFSSDTWEQKIYTLSGGQKTRIGLIKLILAEPDVLLLDEPTNHVDISSLEWLENYLKNYKKTVVIISHDRYFLDNIAGKIIELENTKAYSYKGNYTDFLNKKAEDREIRQKQYELQQREIRRIEEMIVRLKQWGREKLVRQAFSKQKYLDRMEKKEKPGKLPDKIKLEFGDKKHNKVLESGNDVLSVKELAKSFPPKKLFENMSFEVKKHDNFFIIGPNGCGKSTLLKILTENQTADSGRFYFGYNVQIGYYDQENQDLDDENTVLDELWDDYENMTQLEVRNILAAFLFRNDDIEKKVKIISGGERARLTIAKLILKKSNVLILDEPTNHLDINSREALEAALLNFKGTIIAVSHDRYFIKKLATRILEINPDYSGGYIDYKDGYEEFVNYKKNYLSGLSLSDNINQNQGADPDKEQRIIGHERQRQLKKEQERLEKEKKSTEFEIKKTEKRMAELDYMIKDEEVVADYVKLNEIYEEKNILEERLEILYEKYYNNFNDDINGEQKNEI
ncbi:MAG: ABC-F family ATP-binding cassette domain-containing protein [Oscillospiraceae bacterium]|nr:ABC-F family ATP-binding cassette domain-containing protein [Oscillospiraceae bacterium]